MPYWWSKERNEGTSGIGGLTRHIKGLSGYAALNGGGGLDVYLGAMIL